MMKEENADDGGNKSCDGLKMEKFVRKVELFSDLVWKNLIYFVWGGSDTHFAYAFNWPNLFLGILLPCSIQFQFTYNFRCDMQKYDMEMNKMILM